MNPPIQLYPNASQVITVVDLGFMTVELISPPNTMTGLEPFPALAAECPGPLLVIPPNPTRDLVTLLLPTACAMKCAVLTFSESEVIASQLLFCIAWFASVVCVINVYFTDRKKINPTTATLSLLLFFYLSLRTPLLFRANQEGYMSDVCYDVASPRLISDIPLPFPVFVGLLEQYVVFKVVPLCGWLVAFELLLRVVFEIKDITYYR